MKTLKRIVFAILPVLVLAACGKVQTNEVRTNNETPENAVEIILSDEQVTVGGEEVSLQKENAVYKTNDIVYYEEGKDLTYGEGTGEDAHSKDEADAHTVIYITKPGTYSVSGTLSKGQIAVDLGEDAEDDPSAVVTLILNGVDITCSVAPAVIFYNVYECGDADTEKATKDVDTSLAGANVIIADGTQNIVNGSYVARIYKPDSVVLNEDGTEVEEAKKLHKYDAAFYSRMSMNVGGGKDGTGILTINAQNEGLDSELHLTINGGFIYINSGNDGINTNEDGVSVTTVNGGELHIKVTGETGEGDGIDSNGWLVINGGTVTAQACSTSMDSGIDSDMGIHINGGRLIATGSMLDRIEEGSQKYAVFSVGKRQKAGSSVYLKNSAGETVMDFSPENDYSTIIFSSPDMTEEEYTLWDDENEISASNGNAGGRPGGFGGMMPPDNRPAQRPDGDFPENMPEGFPAEFPEGFPENFEMPEDFEIPEGLPEDFRMPEGEFQRPEFDGEAYPEGFEGGGRMKGKGENRPGFEPNKTEKDETSSS